MLSVKVNVPALCEHGLGTGIVRGVSYEAMSNLLVRGLYGQGLHRILFEGLLGFICEVLTMAHI